jgi:hypothetical protein
MEIINTYNKVRKILDIYSSIPGIIFDWVKETFISIIGKNK